jgi:hypothetical protein
VDNDFDPGDGGRDLFAVSIGSGYWAGVDFQDRRLDALNSTAIPTTFSLGDWDQQIFECDGDGFFSLVGSILAESPNNVETPVAMFRVDALVSSVPEPSAAVLLLIGVPLLVRGLRVKRQPTPAPAP